MSAKGDLSLHQSHYTHFSLSTCSCSCTVSLPTPSVHPARHLEARSNRVQWNAIEADPSRYTLQHNRMTPTKRVFTQLNELQLGQICKFNSTSQSNQRVKTAELQRNTILPFESIGERADSSIQGNDNPRTNTHQLEWIGAWDSSLFVDNRPATCRPTLVPCNKRSSRSQSPWSPARSIPISHTVWFVQNSDNQSQSGVVCEATEGEITTAHD